MANILKRVSDNVTGDFFVDATCINCDTCRQIAPATFEEAPDYAYVYRQPRDKSEWRLAIKGMREVATGAVDSSGEKGKRD